MSYHIETPKTNAGVRRIPITDEVADCFARILEDRGKPKLTERMVDGYRGFLFIDEAGMPLVAMHWEHRFNHMVDPDTEYHAARLPPHLLQQHGKVRYESQDPAVPDGS